MKGKDRGGCNPPTTRTTEPGTPGGGLGNQVTGMILVIPKAAALDAGGTPSVTLEHSYARAPPPPLGGGGGYGRHCGAAVQRDARNRRPTLLWEARPWRRGGGPSRGEA